jgi:hypothetical protein
VLAQWHEALASVAAVTSAAVSVAFALAALLPAEAGFSLAVPVSGVLPEPPPDGAVLSDGVGLPVSDGDGEGEPVVVLGLAVGDGLDESIEAAGDDDPVLYTFGVWLHDGEGLGVLDAEERGVFVA